MNDQPPEFPAAPEPIAEGRFRKLVDLIAAGAGQFALILIESDLTDQQQSYWRRRLRLDLQAMDVQLVAADVAPSRGDLAAAVANARPQSAKAWAAAAMNWDEQHAWLTGAGGALLNHSINALRLGAAAPLVVWCTPATLTLLRRESPDFFNHFTALFRFRRPIAIKRDPEEHAQPDAAPANQPDQAARADQPAAPSDRPPSEDDLTWLTPIRALAGESAATAFFVQQIEHASRAAPREQDPAADQPEASAQTLLGLAEAILARPGDRPQTALKAAADMLVRLLASLPADDRPDLRARAHLLQGRVLRQMGRPAPAHTSVRQALTFYTQAARDQPAQYQAWRARARMLLGNLRVDLGRGREACQSLLEAADDYRELAEQYPATFEHELAGSLNHLSNVLRALGRPRQARTMVEQALTLYRKLAKQQPFVFGERLAATLNNLGLVLRNLGQLNQARRAFEQSLTVRRRLAERGGPDATGLKQDIALTLNNLGAVRHHLGDHAAAQQAYEAALVFFREAAGRDAQSLQPHIAGVLNNLGAVRFAMGSATAARRAFEEALVIARRLADDAPEIYEQEVAMTLNNLGLVLRELGEFEAACEAYGQALVIRKRLAEAKPEAYEQQVATTLNNIGAALRDMQRWREARDAFAASLTIYQDHARRAPAAFQTTFDRVLQNYIRLLKAAPPSTRQRDDRWVALWRNRTAA